MGGASPFVDSSTRGRWMQFRYHVKRATGSNALDGVIEMWVDGVLVAGASNLDLYDSSQNYFNQGYLLGWAN